MPCQQYPHYQFCTASNIGHIANAMPIGAAANVSPQERSRRLAPTPRAVLAFGRTAYRL